MWVKLVAMQRGFSKSDVERSFGGVGPNEVSDDALEVSQRTSIGGLSFNTIKCFGYKLLSRSLLSLSWSEGEVSGSDDARSGVFHALVEGVGTQALASGYVRSKVSSVGENLDVLALSLYHPPLFLDPSLDTITRGESIGLF